MQKQTVIHKSPSDIRIAEDYDSSGPVYSSTLADVLDELAGRDWGSQTMSDAFFNCEFVNERRDSEEESVSAAAERFNKALPEPLKSLFTTQWFVNDFFDRL